MGRTISNPPRADKKPVQSEEARKNRAKAGAANLAAYRESVANRTALRHGVVSFLNTGHASAEIATKLDAFEAGLLSDLAAESSAAQKALIESSKVSLGVCLLANAKISQDGLSGLKRNRWLLQTLATFINSTRLGLCALGLERRAKQVETLDSVLADLAAKRADGPEVKPVDKTQEELESQ